MNSETMVYVAADPKQPGAAWAISVDKPEYAKELAKTIAGWIRRGANVMRVDMETGKQMLDKWERPAPAGDLFASATPAQQGATS